MEKEKRSLFQRFLLWREKNIKEKQFILILSFLVGIFTAITALILTDRTCCSCGHGRH